jgi:hypothetical protein
VPQNKFFRQQLIEFKQIILFDDQRWVKGLASVIDVPVTILREVYKGSGFLDRNKAEELAKLLLILFRARSKAKSKIG